MKILMTGATGLIGQKLGQKLTLAGHELVVVTRNADRAKQILSYPALFLEKDLNTQVIQSSEYEEIDCVIHLAGESIDGRWTENKKKKVMLSRKNCTENLLKEMPKTVKIFISASAQGIYGSRGEELLTEDSVLGDGFLSDVCKSWEEPTIQYFSNRELTQRFVIFRIGLVLSREGGALRKLTSLFQKNAGAILGTGQQWMSWISLSDLVELFYQAVENHDFSGVYNAVQPNPVRNAEFTKSLADKLSVGLLPNVPEVILKTILGEMSALVLDSQKVSSNKLMQSKFLFKDTNLEVYLNEELKDFESGQDVFYAEQFIPYPLEKVFAFFSQAENLQRITPELLDFKIKKVSTKDMQKGTLIDYRLKIHGIPASWKTEIQEWKPPYLFVDNQLKGPYAKWHHTHLFQAVKGGTLMTDVVRYRLPLGLLGQIFAAEFVRSDVQKIFDYRRQVIAKLNF